VNVESLHVENFKSIREVDVEFSDLNVFVGRNAAGKSNLFEVFTFLNDVVDEESSDAIQLQGGIKYLRNLGTKENDVKITVGFEPDPEHRPVDSSKSLERKERVINRDFDLNIFAGDDSIDHLYGAYDISVSVWDENSQYKSRVVHLGFTEDKDRIRVHPGNREDIRELLIQPEILDNFPEKVGGLNSGLTESPKFGRKFEINPKSVKSNNSLKGKTQLQPDGSNLALVIKKLLEDDDQKQKFLSLVSDVLPFVSDTKVEAMPDQSLFLEILEEFEPGQDQYIPAEMLSDGTLRVLALIYLLYFSDHEKIFIEEPGRNIHPSLIANLMLKVKDAAENTDKQIFLTTHNVEVLRHTSPEDVRLVSRDEDGFTQVERPAESERVQKFLENDLGMVDLYTENMLGE